MFTKIFIAAIIFSFLLLTNTSNVHGGAICTAPNPSCPQDATCEGNTIPNGDCDINPTSCTACPNNAVRGIFGPITAPGPLAGFLARNPTGGGAISQFLSNGVTLIYSIAGVVLVFMILWGAFEWMTSGGDKEKMSSAQKRIISAIVGILLFAVAFAVIRVLGQFTGFTFFN